MHEIGFCETLLERIEQQRRTRSFRGIRRIRVEIGALSDIEPEALHVAFELLGRGTFIEGARLEIERPAGVGRCPSCGGESAIQSRRSPCPRCAAPRLDIIAGNTSRFIDMEVF
ncbi:MAG: hydrogenase maturation nickel metallochaperone HypA [Telmatospirillum sp.]|nr:hydrogenase maturation nickel metallochaperone HypA [Telmatospirillum sp.]